jgi:hypothetical protein
MTTEKIGTVLFPAWAQHPQSLAVTLRAPIAFWWRLSSFSIVFLKKSIAETSSFRLQVLVSPQTPICAQGGNYGRLSLD